MQRRRNMADQTVLCITNLLKNINVVTLDFTGISNSNSQREYIMRTAKERGLNVENINIVTCNVADDKGALDVVKGNDRVLSIEM